MKTIVIFGAGGTGTNLLRKLEGTSQVVAFLDNDASKWGKTIDNIPVHSPDTSAELVCDEFIIASLIAPWEMKQQLIENGVPEKKINLSFVESFHDVRIQWLRDYALLSADKPGNIAEAGVYRADFAKEINRCFPGRKLYLFDTFSGFDSRDVTAGSIHSSTVVEDGYLCNTSIELVLERMPHPEDCVIKQGWFPETAQDVDDTFCFVSLDMDLYAPTLAGIEFFLPKLCPGGVLLIHDYYSPRFGDDVRNAIQTYQKKEDAVPFQLMPIGDHISIALLPQSR